MTEDEAKQKWCPMTRDEHHNRCIASGCMMWRWDYSPREVKRYVEVNPESTPPEADGHCGLAGEEVQV
jgi:hypothetical protein